MMKPGQEKNKDNDGEGGKSLTSVANNNIIMEAMTDNYNDRNQSQSTVWKYAKPLFAKALQEYNLSSSNSNETSTFRVADFGCATGGNSIAPLSFVSNQLLRRQNNNCNLEIFLVDLPSNAWNSVTAASTGVTPESIITTAADLDGRSASNNIFVYMVGRTFYECCVPANTLDLSYSFVAIHWMRTFVGNGSIPSGLYATDPLHNKDPVSLQAWRDAGRQDFALFLQARQQELKVNGKFIGTVACPKKNGDYPWSKVGKALYDILLSKVADPHQDLAACVLPCCWRTEADVRAGFDDTTTASNNNNNGDYVYTWDLETCEFHQTKDPIREELERGEISPNEYGHAVMDAFHAVCHPTCVAALTKSIMSSKEKAEQLLKDAYQDTIHVIASDPEQYNLDVSFWYVVAKKTITDS